MEHLKVKLWAGSSKRWEESQFSSCCRLGTRCLWPEMGCHACSKEHWDTDRALTYGLITLFNNRGRDQPLNKGCSCCLFKLRLGTTYKEIGYFIQLLSLTESWTACVWPTLVLIKFTSMIQWYRIHISRNRTAPFLVPPSDTKSRFLFPFQQLDKSRTMLCGSVVVT